MARTMEWEPLIEVLWLESERRWTVRARAGRDDSWSVWLGDESELDELMSLARDTATGG